MFFRVLFLGLALACVSTSTALAQQPSDADVAWIKQQAVPIKTVVAENGFDDLEPLKKLIGDARIVSLGESTHGSREIFQMKHRLLEFLAAEMGFTIFSIEANLPEAYRLNDYVLRGEGDPDQLIGGMYFWTWNTREVKDQVQWMRKFNQAGKGRVEFTGFDMQTPDVAKQEVLKFLKLADAGQHVAAEAAYGLAAQSIRTESTEFGVATGSFPVAAARGKKVTYRGWIKTEKVGQYAGLWWRADGPEQKVLVFDNMQAKKFNGTKDWEQFTIELKVPAEAANVNFGVLMPGAGTAWFDGLEVLLDDKPFTAPDNLDLDFEADTVRGLTVFPFKSYRVELDGKVAKTGKQSLRIRSVDAPGAVSPDDFKAALAACEEVHAKLQSSRDELAKKHAAKEVDWALVNARLVANAMRQRGGNMAVRDPAMAENVAWILQQNPDAKVVLWAHNYHVSKQAGAMGKYLDQKFGKSHLAVGFATAKGEYQAIGKAGLANHKLQAPPTDSYEAAFQKAGVPRFFLDLRPAKGDAKEAAWLTKPRPFRSIGALATDQQFAPANLPALFDAVIYLEETTAALPLRP